MDPEVQTGPTTRPPRWATAENGLHGFVNSVGVCWSPRLEYICVFCLRGTTNPNLLASKATREEQNFVVKLSFGSQSGSSNPPGTWWAIVGLQSVVNLK